MPSIRVFPEPPTPPSRSDPRRRPALDPRDAAGCAMGRATPHQATAPLARQLLLPCGRGEWDRTCRRGHRSSSALLGLLGLAERFNERRIVIRRDFALFFFLFEILPGQFRETALVFAAL